MLGLRSITDPIRNSKRKYCREPVGAHQHADIGKIPGMVCAHFFNGEETSVRHICDASYGGCACCINVIAVPFLSSPNAVTMLPRFSKEREPVWFRCKAC